MAIKISGNTVISDARELSNIASLDSTTISTIETSISTGATGAGGDEIFWENGQNVTSNYTITNGKNAMSAGPITIDSGITVTIGTGEAWTIV